MAQSDTSPLVSAQRVDIDHVNVAAPTKSSTAQTLNALTPLLTVLITAIGLVFTFCFQLVQNRTEALQKVDTDWRTAVASISVNENAAATGAFEMQSFFKSAKYKDQAKTISAIVIPSIPDKSEFDAAFFELVRNADERNQGEIISIAKDVSDQIRDICNGYAVEKKKDDGFCDQTIGDFVINPQNYFSEDTESDQIKKVLTESWKLDSANSGLSTLWQDRQYKPGTAELSGIIFYNSNLHGVDLTQTSLDGAVFIGTCTVDPSLLPKGLPAPQCTPK
jgi:Tfp pilus assembly protein PilV